MILLVFYKFLFWGFCKLLSVVFIDDYVVDI